MFSLLERKVTCKVRTVISDLVTSGKQKVLASNRKLWFSVNVGDGDVLKLFIY